MIKVSQTKFGRGEGNCWSACLASIFELHLDEVPSFKGENWWLDTQRWVERHGYGFVEVVIEHPEGLELFGQSLWIASGKSPRGNFDHSVLYCGSTMIHDPHPDGTGLDGSPTRGSFFTKKL